MSTDREMSLREYLDSRPLYKKHRAYLELNELEDRIAELESMLDRLGDMLIIQPMSNPDDQQWINGIIEYAQTRGGKKG